jgi:hypothetical protein
MEDCGFISRMITYFLIATLLKLDYGPVQYALWVFCWSVKLVTDFHQQLKFRIPGPVCLYRHGMALRHRETAMAWRSALIWHVPQCRYHSTPLFEDNLPVPSSRFKQSIQSWTAWTLKMGLVGCPEMLVWNYHSVLCQIQECADLIWIWAEAWNHAFFTLTWLCRYAPITWKLGYWTVSEYVWYIHNWLFAKNSM